MENKRNGRNANSKLDMYRYYNPNPKRRSANDCVIRAISKITGLSWDDLYIEITSIGFVEKEMPSTNAIWGILLKRFGFRKYLIPDTCPDCYTVKDFCMDNPFGSYILGTGSHVVAVINGDYYDSWDSGNEIPVYYWKEKVNAFK